MFSFIKCLDVNRLINETHKYQMTVDNTFKFILFFVNATVTLDILTQEWLQ